MSCLHKYFKKNFKSRHGFTLLEMVLVLAISGVLIGIFYTTWIINWTSFEEHTVRADLWQDANKIIERMSLDAREATQIELQDNRKTVIFRDKQDQVLAIYRMLSGGVLQAQRNTDPSPEKMTDFINLDNSFFDKKGKGLKVRLVLSEPVLGRPVDIVATTQIYPRN